MKFLKTALKSASLLFLFCFITATVRSQAAIKWKFLANIPPSPGKNIQPGMAGAFSGVHSNHLIVAGGANFPAAMPWEGGEKVFYRDVYIFDLSAKKWIDHSFKLPRSIAYGASVNTRNGILCIGGRNNDSLFNDAFFLHYNNKTGDLSYTQAPALPEPLFNMAASSLHNTVYVAGGEDFTDTKNVFYKLDLNKAQPIWENLPVWNGPSLSQSVLVSMESASAECLYLIGGKHNATADSSFFVSSVYLFEPKSTFWSAGKSVCDDKHTDIKISGGTGFDIGEGRMLLVGGNTSNLYDSIILAIHKVSQAPASEEKKINKHTLDSLFSAHPGFEKKVYEYNTVLHQWSQHDFPFEMPVTLNAFKYKCDIYLPSGEIKPGIRSPKILVGKPISK